MEDDSGYVYEESAEEQSSGGSGPFFTAVAVLVAIFILAVGAAAVILMTRDGGSSNVDAAQATSIAATNESILAQNARVTETIAAMETEAARPTDTPTPPPPTFTPEPSPTNTPRPTNTPVVADVDEETEGEAADGTPNVSGTSVFEDSTEDSTPTPIPVVGGSNDTDALPDTGFELWAIVLAGIVLVGILAAARRMRGA
jgi:cytoskeletal protein RodZ